MSARRSRLLASRKRPHPPGSTTGDHDTDEPATPVLVSRSARNVVATASGAIDDGAAYDSGEGTAMAPTSRTTAVTEALLHPRSKKKLAMTAAKDEESTGLDSEHALREASTTTPKSRSATDILLGTVVRETADGKRTRKEEIARLTGLRKGKGGTLVPITSPTTVETPLSAKMAASAEATPSPLRRVGVVRTQRALDTQLDALKTAAAAVTVSEEASVPLPDNLKLLLAKMKALDLCVLAARTLEQRSFNALKASVEKQEPETNFTKEDLERIIAVDPSLFAVEVAIVSGERQWVIKHAGKAALRAARSLELKARADDFERALRARIDIDNIGDNVEDATEYEIEAKDMESAALPTISAPINAGAAAALGGKLKTDAASAAVSSSTSSKGGSLSSIRDRVRAKQLAKMQAEREGVEERLARKTRLEHVLQHVVDFVAGQKPSIEGKMPHKTQLLAKAVVGLQGRARAHGTVMIQAYATELITLVCEEVATLCAQKPAWCWVGPLTVDGETTDYLRVYREFDKAAVKAHLEELVRALG